MLVCACFIQSSSYLAILLHQVTEHDDALAPILVYHLPEVTDSVLQRTLSGYEGLSGLEPLHVSRSRKLVPFFQFANEVQNGEKWVWCQPPARLCVCVCVQLHACVLAWKCVQHMCYLLWAISLNYAPS